MRRILSAFVTIVIIFSISACSAQSDSENPLETNDVVSIEEAKELIREMDDFSHLSNLEFELIDITEANIWDQTGCQLFKINHDLSLESFVIKGQKAAHIGLGFGGFGVTSAVPYDVNQDGVMDIVFAYSFGSGLHRSLISWFDSDRFEQHDIVDDTFTNFRQYDLILKIEEEQVVVYRIVQIDENAIDYDCLLAYPTEEDISHMTLVQDGILVWKNGEFELHINY